MANTGAITPRQLQLLKAIAQFKAGNYFSPTIGELAEQLDISRSTAFEHIAELRKKGFVTTIRGKARSLETTSRAHALLDRARTNQRQTSGEEKGIPLAGRIAAGPAIEAVQQREVVSLASQFGHEDVFALEVRGDSMIEEGIYDGDYVICRRSSVAQTGQIVVAMVDEHQATLKKFYKEAETVRLQPANPAYDPIYSRNCRIQAVVVGLIRKFVSVHKT